MKRSEVIARLKAGAELRVGRSLYSGYFVGDDRVNYLTFRYLFHHNMIRESHFDVDNAYFRYWEDEHARSS